MKKENAFCLSLLLSMMWLAIFPTDALAQSESVEINNKYYLVVAAFDKSRESNAQTFVRNLSDKGQQAQYTSIPGRRWFFVVLKGTDDFGEAMTQMYMNRKSGQHPKCWVYRNRAYDPNKKEMDPKPVEETPTTENESIPTEQDTTSVVSIESQDSIVKDNTTNAPEMVVGQEIEEIRIGPKRTTDAPGKMFYFNVFAEVTGDRLDGEVSIIDPHKVMLIKTVKGNRAYELRNHNSNPAFVLTCETFGFRKLQHEINYNSPFTDSEAPYVVGVNDTVVVNFEMIRYKKDDIFTLFHVYFHKDAEVMRRDSQFELDQLQNMMEANPNYKIRIHGHTNGNSFGKIVHRISDNQFFTLNDSNGSGKGSAKKLSETRADVLKEYLVSKGVADDRIETVGWGGKRMIYDKNSEQAKKNVRVEIEIIED